MPKTLTARNAELSERPSLAPVPLVVLTFYTDRGAGTVDTRLFYSDRDVRAEWDGAVRDFQPFIERVEPYVVGSDYLPSPTTAAALERKLSLVLANRVIDGVDKLSKTLAALNLDLCQIEVSQILVDRNAGEDFTDLEDVGDSEIVPWFRGELDYMGDATPAEIPLNFRSELPQTPDIVLADPATNDPIDLGKRIPRVYGSAKSVPCLGVIVGSVTTLAETISAAAGGTVQVTDASGFGSSGSGRIGAEEIEWTNKGPANFGGVTRGHSGTTGAVHAAGEVISELVTTAIYAVAGHEVNAIGNAYVISPYTGELVRITTAFTKTVADTTSISGETIASVSLTIAQLRLLLADLAQAAAVTTQPNVSTQAVYSVDDTASSTIQSGTGNTLTTGGAAYCNSFGYTDGGYRFIDGVVGDVDRMTLTFSAAGLDTTRKVKRWRVVANCNLGKGTLGGGAITVECAFFMNPGGDWGSSLQKTISYSGNDQTIDAQDVSAWRSTTGDVFASDLAGEDVFITPDGGNEDWFVWIPQSGMVGVELEFYPSDLTQDVNAATTTAAIEAASVGYGLRIFADVDGYEVPAADTNFSVAAGALIESLPDILRNEIAIIAGLGHSAVDSTTFDAAETNLGSNVHALVTQDVGETFSSFTSRLCFEGRARMIQEEGASETVYKLITAESDYEWPAAAVTLTEWQECSKSTRLGETIKTRFRALYDFDRSLGRLDESSYRLSLRADVDLNDISGTVATSVFTAAEQRYGRQDHNGFFFLTITDDATAEEVLGYYCTELVRVAAVYTLIGVPWVEGFPIERGDIIDLIPGVDDDSTTVKAQVIEYTKDFLTEFIDLVAVEII